MTFSARIIAMAALAGFGLSVAGTAAYASSSSANYYSARLNSSSAPELISRADREYYTELFNAIDRADWARVNAMLAARNDGPLHGVAKAEFYLHAGSPRVEAPEIASWLQQGRNLPHAGKLVRLGQTRGLEYIPELPRAQQFTNQPYSSKRIRPRETSDGTMPGSVQTAILEHIKNDDPDGARQLLDGIDANLSSQARAEWRQRVAFSYYIENNDPAAFAMAQTVAQGSGPWVAEGDWVAGLAAWRMGDCEQSGQYFERSAQGSTNVELTAAAYYWAARANIRCRAPEKAQELLRGAARLDETLYGMLAAEQLHQALPTAHETPDFDMADWQKVRDVENVRVAVALAEIGRDTLADEVLRHQATIGAPDQYPQLSRLARELGLPSTQLWMAHNAPRGARAEPALRFPAPKWQPTTGWKVDPALAYAHALQESNFRTAVVSPAGAKGLMQIMPIAAREHAPSLNMNASYANLADPSVNLAFGQSALESLRDSRATGGLLPKIMAAYNAGLTPITRWNTEINDQGDPLLYMESIPYWETRGYVAIVMRNYWMYERQAGGASESRAALAQGMWPTFPGITGGGRGVRVASAD
jgi:soluble lytic murein transglycosylase-like protein